VTRPVLAPISRPAPVAAARLAPITHEIAIYNQIVRHAQPTSFHQHGNTLRRNPEVRRPAVMLVAAGLSVPVCEI
jgi:hypothetical protein